MAELIVRLEQRKKEFNGSVKIEKVVVENSCSGRADGSWR